MTQAARNRMTLRTADPSEARKLYALIQANLDEGHLLPRTCSELATHATRFVVAVRGPRIVGCAELASLSPQVAEVRSLAVDRDARGQGIGVTIVDVWILQKNGTCVSGPSRAIPFNRCGRRITAGRCSR